MTNLSQKNGTDKIQIHTNNPNRVDILTTIEEITPKQAETWLKFNLKNNRKQSESHIAYLAEQMKKGFWELNGEAIKFDTSNNLIDGQHRLQAIVKSGVTVKSLVVKGVPTEFFYTIDQGKARTIANALSFDGYANTNNLSAAINYVNRINRKFKGFVKTSSGESFAFIKDNPEILASVDYCLKLYKNSGYRGLSASIAAALHFLFSKKDGKAADKFFYKLYTGAELTQDGIILRLRNKMGGGKIQRIPSKYKVIYTIKAWGSIRTASPLKILKYNPSTHKFPEII